MIDIGSLESAVRQLQTSLRYAGSDSARRDEELFAQFRSASIQAFEFTYELCHKLLKRYLEETEPNPASIDEWTFQDLIRTGAERGLLKSSWDHWRTYRRARGVTSHTYSQAYANEVFAQIPAFLEEACHLRDEINRRQAL